MSARDEDLERLAGAAGIAVHWRDAAGRERQVAAEVLAAILGELGLAAGSPGQIADSLALLADAEARDWPPLRTARQGEATEIGLPDDVPGDLPFRVDFEDGGHMAGTARRVGARRVSLPAVDRPGYHALLLGGLHCRLAVAPRRCFTLADALQRDDGRLWALGAQLYSLRREAGPAAASGGAGFGDFTALRLLAEAAAARGASAVAISPVHAMFSADPAHYSPYSPSSRLFLNAFHIDPAAAFGQEALAAVRRQGLEPELARLDRLDLIAWPEAARARLAVLREVFEVFSRRAESGETAAFEAFARAGGAALETHARFEAIHAWRVAQTGSMAGWRHWPAAFRSPDSPAVREFARHHEREVRFHLFLQWLAARGLNDAQAAARAAGMPIGLIADLAVGTDAGGSHAWTRQEEVVTGLSSGAPPDLFNAKGQAWGLTVFSPRALRAQGYRAFIEMLRGCLAHAGGVRIDHAIGLARMWLVPDGALPTDGAYVRYPFQDMMRLIALESWRHRAIVVGENLGTVPAGFNELIAEAGMLGTDVLWFARESEEPGARFLLPAAWSPDALATTTTHDLPTVAGWWRGIDIGWQERFGLLPDGRDGEDQRALRRDDKALLRQVLERSGAAEQGTAHEAPDRAPVDAVLDFVARSPSPLLQVPLEDLLGLEQQPNLPGTIDEHPNWRRRLPVAAETLLDQPGAAERVRRLARARPR